jgi:hypothetical protein
VEFLGKNPLSKTVEDKRMTASTCALCGQNRECLAKEIDGMEYDICLECLRKLAEALKGKGRVC